MNKKMVETKKFLKVAYPIIIDIFNRK